MVAERWGLTCPFMRLSRFAREPHRQQRLDQMRRDMSDDRNHDAVARQMISLVISFRQRIIIGKPHQPPRFARRYQPRPHPALFDDEQKLAT